MKTVQSAQDGPPVDVEAGASGRAWVPYAVPMLVFVIITMFESRARGLYPLLYIVKVVLVTACVLAFRRPLREIQFDHRVLLPAVIVGAAVFIEWIWLDPLTHYPHFAFLGKQRSEYNPFISISNPGLRIVFLATRFYGLAILVPVVEEIFWRSFLLRIFTDPDDFTRVRIGNYSWIAFIVVALAFGTAHPEWLEAILCAVAYALLLRQTRSLFACIAAHSVTNLMLGIYILTYHAWNLW